jgi:hypothetical protein
MQSARSHGLEPLRPPSKEGVGPQNRERILSAYLRRFVENVRPIDGR